MKSTFVILCFSCSVLHSLAEIGVSDGASFIQINGPIFSEGASSCLSGRWCEGTFQYVPPNSEHQQHPVLDRIPKTANLADPSSITKCRGDWENVNITVGNRQKPRSTDHEDVLIYDRFFAPGGSLHTGVTGVFLEMGAFDGIAESNTLLFERCLGWKGVLIEANPTVFAKLASPNVRPTAHKINMAASCKHDHSTIEFWDTQKESSMEVRHPFGKQPVIPEKDIKKKVHCGPLSQYLQELNISKIDFFSLDVEGAELDVLETFDFNAVPIGVLMVESSNRDCKEVCPKRDAVRALLAKKGATFHEKLVKRSDVFTF